MLRQSVLGREYPYKLFLVFEAPHDLDSDPGFGFPGFRGSSVGYHLYRKRLSHSTTGLMYWTCAGHALMWARFSTASTTPCLIGTSAARLQARIGRPESVRDEGSEGAGETWLIWPVRAQDGAVHAEIGVVSQSDRISRVRIRSGLEGMAPIDFQPTGSQMSVRADIVARSPLGRMLPRSAGLAAPDRTHDLDLLTPYGPERRGSHQGYMMRGLPSGIVYLEYWTCGGHALMWSRLSGASDASDACLLGEPLTRFEAQVGPAARRNAGWLVYPVQTKGGPVEISVQHRAGRMTRIRLRRVDLDTKGER
jgi:hypothetical protein